MSLWQECIFRSCLVWSISIKEFCKCIIIIIIYKLKRPLLIRLFKHWLHNIQSNVDYTTSNQTLTTQHPIKRWLHNIQSNVDYTTSNQTLTTQHPIKRRLHNIQSNVDYTTSNQTLTTQHPIKVDYTTSNQSRLHNIQSNVDYTTSNQTLTTQHPIKHWLHNIQTKGQKSTWD